MNDTASLSARLGKAVNRQRLVDTALRLIAVPSRTGEGGAVADCLAQLLREDGFQIERPAAGHPNAPAVVVRLATGKPGRTLQFDGHLDVVHLPFVPPQLSDGSITGSGACDMKGGVAAAVEALRVLRDANALSAGGVLFTAHDLHEAPWGFGQQLDRLIGDGVVGDGVLLPEPLTGHLPIVGRGAARWKVTIRRSGLAVHEVMRPADEPNVLAAGAELVTRLTQQNDRFAQAEPHPAGVASVFVGQFHGGEIYNQYPQESWLEGTRRWLPGISRAEVEQEFRSLLDGLAKETRTTIAGDFRVIRDAFELNPDDPLVAAFQGAHETISGRPLPAGPKAFVDDGNSFCGLAGVPAITHGPRSGGQHTVHEWVSIADLERVAHLYALTAALYCQDASSPRR
jgi:acetylornithine deacetylase/succinyl-diaminopimelate desuccinylase-like protein